VNPAWNELNRDKTQWCFLKVNLEMLPGKMQKGAGNVNCAGDTAVGRQPGTCV
jgi:hypothetical protein